MTKKIIAASLMLAIATLSRAQILTTFPTEKEKFIKTLDQMMKASKADNLTQADDDFNKNIKDGVITDAQLQQVIATANIIAPRNLSPFPYYFNFITAINDAAKNKLGNDKFNNWLDVAGSVAKNQKKGDNRDLAKFLEFSVAMFGSNAMFHSSSRSWESDAKNYTIAYQGNKAVITFPQGTLTGKSTTDTIHIFNTTGQYFPSENKWYGTGGKVDWARTLLNPNNIYATFKNTYTINFDNTSYSVDSVEFYYKDFFLTPLHGRFTDKFISGMKDSAASYPRFDSRGQNIVLKDIVPNATYRGGFGLWGAKVMGFGTADSASSVTFYRKDKQKMLTAYSQSFTIKKGEEISSPKAAVVIFNGNDTIFHPELTLTYKTKNNEVKMLRGEAGIAKSKFFDSYHNHEFEADAIIWNLDSTRMLLKTLNGVGQVGSIFESNNYFNKEKIRQIQGGAPYDPLSIIKKMYEKTGDKQLNASDLAKAIDPHLTEEQAKSLYYQLVEQGFIRYDEAAGIVTMRDKVINYVMSNAKRVDYDIIRIKSVPKDGIDYIDLKTNNIELKGVKNVPISDTANVVIFPANKALEIQKDRNMVFDGMVYGGRLDFFGKKYLFAYAPFTIDLNGLDSMRINIPDTSGKLDENGQPKLVTLLTDIIGVKGLLEIDAPKNKSGKTRLLQFPKLTSREKSYASYEDPNIAGGAYKRSEFYFEIEPFKLDSLNSFTPSVINWAGKLVSGGIFPDISNKLHIMPDLSLGFEINTPDKGLSLYKDGSNYEGDVTLNHKGLTGKGKIKHLTATINSEDIKFYPDSLRAVADSFHIAKVADGVRTPDVVSSGNMVFWKPKSDSMLIMMKDTPFAMYDHQTSLKGNLLLRSSGLRGSGILDWKEANLISQDFRFRSEDLAADTASMSIKSATGDKVTFKTPNVNAKIDFKNRVGDFKSNTPEIPTEFAYNNFKTAIPEFKWYIDQKILDFKVPPGSDGEDFTSTRESQMGLKFKAKRATYNLETSILRVEQIPYILIADAKIIPDSGVVVIQGEAKINQLKNATILVDTITSNHKIEGCTIEIISKADMKASGDYKFSCKDHKDERITFNNIRCNKEVIGEKKEQFSQYSLVAKGNISELDSFFIYPHVTFKGEATLYGRNPYLFFKGYARINFKNPDVSTTDFSIVDDVNPENLLLHYDSASKSSDGAKVVTGIYFNKTAELPLMYHALFSQIQNVSDLCIYKAPGVVSYNEKTKEYLMGDEDRVTKPGTLKGNVLRYNDDKGLIKGEGEMSLGAEFGAITAKSAGIVDVDVKQKQYTFNMTFGIDMRTNNKLLEEKLQTIMQADNTDLGDINYETPKFKMQFANLSDPKADDKLIKDLEAAPIFKRPKDFNYNLVFSDVNFIYDPDDLTLRSYGKIGLSFVGDKGIHKRLDGCIEIGLKNNNFNIYLKTGTNEWFFFEYKPGTLGLVSSYDEYNKLVSTMTLTPPDKRRITGENGQYYVCTIGSTINKGAFLDAMKEKSNPLLPQEKVIIRPKPAPKDSASKGTIPAKTDSTKPLSPAIAVPAKTDSTSGAVAPEKEVPKSAAQRRAEKLKEKAEQDNTTLPTPAPITTPVLTAPAQVPTTTDTTKKVPLRDPSILTPILIVPPKDTIDKAKTGTIAAPDTTIKAPTQPSVVPVRQPDAPKPQPVVPATDTTAKAPAQPTVVPVKQPDAPKPQPVVPTPDTTAKAPAQPTVVPVKQPDVPKPQSVVPTLDTTAKAPTLPAVVPVKQPDAPKPQTVVPAPDTTAKAPAQPAVVPVKQPDAPKSQPVVPAPDTAAKVPAQPAVLPVKQPEAPKPQSIVPAPDTTHKVPPQPAAVPAKQPDAGMQSVPKPQLVTPPSDTTAKSAAAPVIVPVRQNTAPIDSNAMKQVAPAVTDTTGKK